MAQNESERSENIKTVINERNRLVTNCILLNDAMTDGNRQSVQNRIIMISGILSNMGGFCDKRLRTQIDTTIRLLSMSMRNPLTEITYDAIRSILPIISWIKVDFIKRPLKIIGFNIGNFGFKGERR